MGGLGIELQVEDFFPCQGVGEFQLRQILATEILIKPRKFLPCFGMLVTPEVENPRWDGCPPELFACLKAPPSCEETTFRPLLGDADGCKESDIEDGVFEFCERLVRHPASCRRDHDLCDIDGLDLVGGCHCWGWLMTVRPRLR